MKLKTKFQDAEEQKEGWFIQSNGLVKILQHGYGDNDYFVNMAKEIGNYFETKEEAEKAVERLRAWERLKEKVVKFDGIDNDEHGMIRIKVNLHITELNDPDMCILKDFKYLFGGEE